MEMGFDLEQLPRSPTNRAAGQRPAQQNPAAAVEMEMTATSNPLRGLSLEGAGKKGGKAKKWVAVDL